MRVNQEAQANQAPNAVLALNSIELNGTATDKAGAIKEAGDLLVASGNVDPSYVD